MSTPSDPSDSQPSPARQRAEARKQKILTRGNDRLAKITGAMKGHQDPVTQNHPSGWFTQSLDYFSSILTASLHCLPNQLS